jgi:hypothetical protein
MDKMAEHTIYHPSEPGGNKIRANRAPLAASFLTDSAVTRGISGISPRYIQDKIILSGQDCLGIGTFHTKDEKNFPVKGKIAGFPKAIPSSVRSRKIISTEQAITNAHLIHR